LPTVVFAPQGLGNHVDHLQVIRAVRAVTFLADRVMWYRDTPYAIHQASAHPSEELPTGLCEMSKSIDDVLSLKVAGCRCYKTQIPFQFTSEATMTHELYDFASEEGRRLGAAHPSEAFLTDTRSRRGELQGQMFGGMLAAR